MAAAHPATAFALQARKAGGESEGANVLNSPSKALCFYMERSPRDFPCILKIRSELYLPHLAVTLPWKLDISLLPS